MSGLIIRRLQDKDIPEVSEIEHLAFGDAGFRNRDLLKILRADNVRSATVIGSGSLLGYAVWTIHKDCLQMVTLAVHPDNVMYGIGSDLLTHIKTKLSPRRERIEAIVQVDNLVASKFLRKNGFTAITVLMDSGREAYFFSFDGRKIGQHGKQTGQAGA